MQNLHLKRIHALNMAELADLIRESHAQGFRFLDRLAQEYQDGTNHFDLIGEALFGVYDGENLIAVGGLNHDPFVFDPQVGRIRRVYVASAYRRQGVGKMLLDALVEEARSHFKLLTLRTDTPEASAFYESLGFQTEPPIESATHHLQLTSPPYYPAPVVRYAL